MGSGHFVNVIFFNGAIGRSADAPHISGLFRIRPVVRNRKCQETNLSCREISLYLRFLPKYCYRLLRTIALTFLLGTAAFSSVPITVADVTCTINPARISLSSPTHSATVTVTIRTTTQSRMSPLSRNELPVALASVLASVLLRRERKHIRGAFLCLILL